MVPVTKTARVTTSFGAWLLTAATLTHVSWPRTWFGGEGCSWETLHDERRARFSVTIGTQPAARAAAERLNIERAENIILGPRLYPSSAPRDIVVLISKPPARFYELLDSLAEEAFISVEEVELAKRATEHMLTVEAVDRALTRRDKYYAAPHTGFRDAVDWTSDKSVAEYERLRQGRRLGI
jgi:hypothetical protein